MRSLEERQKLFDQWLGLPRHVGMRFFHWAYKKDGDHVRHAGADDLEQAGLVALWNATELWDPDREGAAKFQTYAWKCIYFAMRSAITKDSRQNRVGIEPWNHGSFTDEEIKEGRRVRCFKYTPPKLERGCADGEEGEEEEDLAAPHDHVKDLAEAEVMDMIVTMVLPHLSERERECFEDSVVHRLSYTEIALKRGISPQRVQKVMETACAKCQLVLMESGYWHHWAETAKAFSGRDDYLAHGQRFGNLHLESRTRDGRGGVRQWRCRCDCGRARTVTSNDLLAGNVASCGECVTKEVAA